MYLLKKFSDNRFNCINSLIDSYENYANNYINLVGSASLPFPELSQVGTIPSSLCRIEGHLNARLFPLTEPIDIIENYIKEKVYKFFQIDKEYDLSSQLHSATQANHAIYRALLKDNDIVLSLGLKHGGHISHKLGLPKTTQHYEFPILNNNIDYDKLEDLVKELKPKLIIGGGTSFPWEIDFKRLKNIARYTNSFLMADLAHIAPFIISGLHSPVFPYADVVTIDTSKSLRGPRGAILIYRKSLEKKVIYSIFPLEQSSPNQDSMIKKACCLNCWEIHDIVQYSSKLIEYSQLMQSIFNQHNIQIAFGGTNSHLIIIDVGKKFNLTGKDAELLLMNNGILVNRNQIPNDNKDPWIASGIRISTTSLVILGYSTDDIKLLTKSIIKILNKNLLEKQKINYLINKYHSNTINISSERT